ncbi:MAG: DEAD/DEAH box helicase family protein [Bdellovibrionales bacterium]|nr:DEAD/DEAH box helicase family protein [Bdellovibrionales bacterium]
MAATQQQHLRRWQRDAFDIYLARLANAAGTPARAPSVLWEATPGAGKTTAALTLCKHQKEVAQARRIVVVVPTTHLKLQWSRAAHRHGIQLDYRFSEANRAPASDFDGIVVTYQQIGNRPQAFARLSKDATVVLDEVHHAADGLTWGDSLRRAFRPARFILCLSGTAFRSDNNTIPFVTYDEHGVSQPDYVYSYADAISERVCRPTVFFTYGGEVGWTDGGVEVQAAFNDALDRTDRTKRLRAALDPSSGWIEPMLRDANEMVSAVRREHPTAAGLLVASSQNHARMLAKVLRDISGKRPVVVLSDDAASTEKLKTFQQSDEPWLVACNMVSEGVDIPRLRVGVYATTIRTKMYFRQFLGRIVRRTPTPRGPQSAFCYLPADPWLRTLAEEIEEEQRHQVFAKAEDPFPERDEEARERKEPVESTWRPTRGFNRGVDAVIMGGSQLTLWGGPQNDYEDSPIREIEPVSSAGAHHEQAALSRAELKEEIVKEIRSLVSRYHIHSGQPFNHIHTLLNRKQSVKSQQNCTEEQLRERLHLLQDLLHKR